MRTQPVSVDATASLAWTRTMMAMRKLTHVPVLRGEQLVGILSEGDLLSFGATAHDTTWLLSPVERAMQPDPKTVGPEDSIHDAACCMAANEISCLPVVELGKLIGLVSKTDLLSAEVFSALEPVAPAH